MAPPAAHEPPVTIATGSIGRATQETLAALTHSRARGFPGRGPRSFRLARPMSSRRQPVLLGRAGERQAFDRLLENVRGGQSAVLVLRGEAGVGKTALVHYCARQASGFRVARI